MSKSNLSQLCYSLLKKIPPGKLTTYKFLAKALDTKAYRAIGQILKKNPSPKTTPCYKVVKSDGSIGGYLGSNKRNINKKIQLLENDGIKIINNKVDLDKYLYQFNSR